MAAVQSNEKDAHKVTQLRTPPRGGIDAEAEFAEGAAVAPEDTAPVSKTRLVRPEPRRARLRGRALSLSAALLAGIVLAGGAAYGIRTVTRHGVMVPFVNDRVAPAPSQAPAHAPAQFAFNSGPNLQPVPQARNPQGAAQPVAQPPAQPANPPDAQSVSPPMAVTNGQAALILDLARQIAAVKAQNEKMASDLADTKKALATLVTDNAAGFGTVNGALGEIRHRVDGIDDSLRARPATPVVAEKPVQPEGTANEPPGTVTQPRPPSAAAPKAPRIVRAAPPAPVVARKTYRVTSGSPSVALIIGSDGATRMVHPIGMAEMPGDSSLPGWGAIRELRQVGDSWEVVTEHGVIH